MNSAVREALEGRDVIVVSPSMVGVRAMFERALDQTRDHASVIRRSNGQERITLSSGGRLRFMIQSHLRGASGDSIMVTDPKMLADPTFLENAMPCLNASDEPSVGWAIG